MLPTPQNSAAAQTPTRTGQRSPTSLSAAGSKTALRSATTVRTPSYSSPRIPQSALLTIITGKKLKRRLEDLERRAASRSLSPNGEDTDGRSTRESSSEGVVSPPPSSEPHLTDPRDTHYNLPPYTAHYRGAYSPPQQSYYPPTTTAEPTTSAEYAPQQHYLYSYSAPTLSSVVEATCGSSVSSSCSGSEHSYLPLPSARLSSSSGYSVSTPPDYSPKTSPIVYSEDHLSPFMSSYANLTETPTDPSFFTSQYYHDDHVSPRPGGHSPIHIKAETASYAS